MQNRFFSTPSPLVDGRILLSKNLTELNLHACPQKVKKLTHTKHLKSREMYSKYNHLLKRHFNGQIVYTLSTYSPEEMIKAGGFKKNTSLWLNTKSGNNTGCVCFSLLPELTALFRDHNKHNFIYAVALQGEYFLPGSKWREIISPGAFPVSNESFFVARQLLEIRDNGQLNLGPLIGRKGKNNFIIQGERFDKFCLNQLVLPKAINQGDDYPLEFEISDTINSAIFQREIIDYYQNREEGSFNSCMPARF